LHPSKLVYWDGYIPTAFEVKKYKAKIQPLVLLKDRCVVPKIRKFELFKQNGFEKVFVARSGMNFIALHRSEVYCPEKSETCFVLFLDALRHDLGVEELKTLKVDLIGNTCTLEKQQDIVIQVENSLLKVHTFDHSKVVALRFPPNFEHTPALKKLSWNGNHMELRCQYFGSKNSGPCDYSFNIVPNSIRSQLERDFLNPVRDPFNQPFVLFQVNGPLLDIMSLFEKGTIDVSVSLTAFELSHGDILMGGAKFKDVKVYQQKKEFLRASIKLFLFDLVPVVVPISLETYVNFKDSLARKEPIDIRGRVEGNVHPEFIWAMYNHIPKVSYSLYCIENDKGEMDLIVYPSDTFAVFEVIDGNVRGRLDDLVPFLKADQRTKTNGVRVSIDFSKAANDDQYFGNKKQFFWRSNTKFEGVQIALLKKDFLDSYDQKYIWSVNSFMDSKSEYKVSGILKDVDEDPQDADDSGRLVI